MLSNRQLGIENKKILGHNDRVIWSEIMNQGQTILSLRLWIIYKDIVFIHVLTNIMEIIGSKHLLDGNTL